MRIVFKLWQKGKQNSIKMPAKSLQNLWRYDQNKMNEILDDLIFNDICDIEVDDRFIEFTCRHFVRENGLYEIRCKSRKSAYSEENSGKSSAKVRQIISKIQSKLQQIVGKSLTMTLTMKIIMKKGVWGKKQIGSNFFLFVI